MSNIKKPPILVFGSSGAIGSQVAESLKRGKHNLILTSKKNSNFNQNLSKKLSSPFFSFDFEKSSNYKSLEKKIRKLTPKLQGLIVSIAKPFPNKFIHNTEDAIFEEQLNIHLFSLHKIIRGSLPLLEASKKYCTPRITYISTEYLIGSPPIKIAPYLSAKSAATTYMKILAKELITKGIKVFILSPGMIRSALTSNIPEEYFKLLILQPDFKQRR